MIKSDFARASGCRLAIAPLDDALPETSIAFAFRQGSPFVEAFDYVIESYFEAGIAQRWQNYIRPPTECTKFDKVANRRLPIVTLNDLQGAQYILAIGLAFSFICLSVEIAVYKIISRQVIRHLAEIGVQSQQRRTSFLAPPEWQPLGYPTPLPSPRRQNTHSS